MKGRLSSALRRNIGQPTTLSIIKVRFHFYFWYSGKTSALYLLHIFFFFLKSHYPETGEPYAPLIFLKRLANVDRSELERLQFSTSTNSDGKGPYLKPANDSYLVTKGYSLPEFLI